MEARVGDQLNGVVNALSVGGEASGGNPRCLSYTVIVTDVKTLERELAPLDAISDHTPKYLLMMDYGPLTSHNGIKQIHVLDWLLKQGTAYGVHRLGQPVRGIIYVLAILHGSCFLTSLSIDPKERNTLYLFICVPLFLRSH